MIAQIFQFLLQFWRQLVPWYLLDSEQVGFVRQLGKPHHKAEVGWHYKHPLGIQVLEAEDGREYPVVLDPQSLRTKDGVDVVVKAIATCSVYDAEKYLLNVCDGRSNIQDLVAGELGWLVARRSAADVLAHRITPELERRSAKAARTWGIHIERVRFAEAAEAPSFRLWNSNITTTGQE